MKTFKCVPAERTAILRAPDIVPLTTAEVAFATGLSPATLRRWACYRVQGKLLPCAKRAGRNVYRASDVRLWMGISEEGRAA